MELSLFYYNEEAKWKTANAGLDNPLVNALTSNGTSLFAGAYGGMFDQLIPAERGYGCTMV